MKIIFLGSDAFATPSLLALNDSKHEVVAVVTQPDKPAGRGQKITACPTALAAKSLGLNLLQPVKVGNKDFLKELATFQADLLAVVAYGQFLPNKLVESVPLKAVNVHPSLLPKYRGAAPIQYALLNGDEKTGVTTITVTDEMDAGDIFLQYETIIDPIETAESLYQSLSELGADLLLKTVEGLEKGELKATPQDSSKVVFAHKLTKEMGHLKWEESAESLYNKVRALNPWPGTYTLYEEKRLKILEAAPLPMESQKKPGTVIEDQEGIIVASGQGALCLLEIQLEGKKKMSANEFLKGHKVPLGTIFK